MSSKPHHIGLDAHLLNLSGNYRSAGINWYIYHLLQNLPSSTDLAFTVFLSEPRAREHFKNLAVARSRLPTHRPRVRILWEQLIQPWALRRERIDLLHALAFAGPLVNSIPWIATVYDLSFVRFPQLFNRANRLYLTWAVRHSVRYASRLIAISASTQRDLVEMFGARDSQVEVIYCGVDPAFSPRRDPSAIDELRARRRLPEKMILHVGTIEPRKNLARLIRAFANAKRAAHLPHTLVLAGARGWKSSEVDAAIEQAGIADAVMFAGYVPQDELPLWYHAADLFVYPSLYEGFGLPPLDAMASGTPVITSNISALPEVVGTAAIQVAPKDESALADAIVRVLGDENLQSQLIERGIVQAAQFSWARAGQATTALYRTVLAERRGVNHVAT